jgi:hypothetical protein
LIDAGQESSHTGRKVVTILSIGHLVHAWGRFKSASITLCARGPAATAVALHATYHHRFESCRAYHFMRYNKEADKFLEDLYKSVGAKTWKQKYNLLEMKLYVVSGSTGFSHDLGWKSKVGCLEYELLERNELIELVLA